MTSQSLQNYLRTYRKRSALSQEDVAYLLGTQSGGNVCRHERFSQVPDLQTALAYEAIYRQPVSALFPGMFEEMQRVVRARSKKLEQREFRGKTIGVTTHRREALATIASMEPKSNLQKE